ncbi:MAG: acyl-CoA dehydrogenase family protein [Gemmatimonadota bacterium]|nr:MAG: acyl-CoA dehydrogenase family protein [Gemmatimonadota bacterium]
MGPEDARRDLDAWRASFPADPYAADSELRALNRRFLDGERLEALHESASEFGRAVADVVGPSAARYEQRAHLPELARYDGVGHRLEEVRFDPSYHRSGVAVWKSGVISYSGTPGRAFEQATLLYLLSLEGEAGHACPVVCTIGLARALRRRASDAVRDRFLPALLLPDYDRADRASQFLTEVQGGSDVGSNACCAVPQPDGTYRLSGEKWFCSVADAHQFLVTARPEGAPDGTAGLGCFVVPRELDGVLNGFSLRRLKEKLGTRGMASGEVDLAGAVAWPIGPVEEGFKTAVGIVLNTSRWMTAIGATGMMRRALLEAAAYARHRRAFGQPIGDFPVIRQTLAEMHMGWLGALHLTWLLTHLEDRLDAEVADETEVLFHRFLVNATKYVTSARATQVVRQGIEVLGGNGTIEDFSVLPRLYRDAMVYESWEGTHNVLVAQVLADLRRLPILDVVASEAARMLEAAEHDVLEITKLSLDQTLVGVSRCVSDHEYGATHFRRLLDRLMLILEVGVLVRDGGDRCLAVAALLARSGLDQAYRAEDDPEFLRRVGAIIDDGSGSESGEA